MASCRLIDRNEGLDLTIYELTTDKQGLFEVTSSGFWTFLKDDCKGLQINSIGRTLNIHFIVDPDAEVVKEFVQYLVKSGKLFRVTFNVTHSTVSRVPVTLKVVELPARICSPDPNMKTFGGSPMYMERSWLIALSKVFETEDFQNLSDLIKKQRSKDNGSRLVPSSENVFAWTWACEFDRVKVVIIGQDPYPGEDVAHGLAFSVKPDKDKDKPTIPISLQNIYKELELELSDEGFVRPEHGYLMGWARQGVLLLNAALTLVDWKTERQRDNRSEQEKDEEQEQRTLWETFTDAVIKSLCQHNYGLVFMLWGGEAKKKKHIIEENMNEHTILESSHPSNMSAYLGFKGCGHFRTCNQVLSANYKGKIDWEMKYEYNLQ